MFPGKHSLFSDHIRSFPKLTKLFKATDTLNFHKSRKYSQFLTELRLDIYDIFVTCSDKQNRRYIDRK